jgi:hypothetical protein
MSRNAGRNAGIAIALGAGIAAAPVLAADDFYAVGTALFGENEVGHEGAGEDASGSFSGEIDMEAGTLCYFLEIEGLDGFTAGHIHKGDKNSNGPPVAVLELAGGGADAEAVCAEVDAELLEDIGKNGEDYYVNVHTRRYPAGAIRGQLGDQG